MQQLFNIAAAALLASTGPATAGKISTGNYCLATTAVPTGHATGWPPSEADQSQTRCTVNCGSSVRSDRTAARGRRAGVQKGADWCMILARA